tara:strand:- start:16751 stop:17752 length:1002 start_codon:yes stop_codon:yes gene_type:complete
MKIAILTPTFNHYSGIDRVVQNQAEEYSKNNEVTVFALESKIKSENYSVVKLGMPKNLFIQRLYRLFMFLDLRKLFFYKSLKNYDVVISHFYPLNIIAYLAKKKFGIKYIYFNHGVNTTGLLDSKIQRIYMILFSLFTNLSLKNVDEAYSVSNYLKNDLRIVSGLDSKVVYNQIDKQRFNTTITGDSIRKKYGLTGDTVLLYVGRIAPHKGVHLLLKIFNKVKSEIPNLKLVIVGKPTFKKYFINLKKKASKDVIFTGFVDDLELPEFYGACDLYVTASFWEGFDLPAAEAQACGKKVVAFDIGSHPEVIKNGSLIRKGDLSEFSKSIVGNLK